MIDDELIEQLKNEFKNSFLETNDELNNSFGNYLLYSKNNLENPEYDIANETPEIKKKYFIDNARRIINFDINKKKKYLLKDENLEELRKLSLGAEQMAIKKAMGENMMIFFNVDERIKKMVRLFENVEIYNKEEANDLISEAILDLNYIKDPNSDILSMRVRKNI